MKKLLFLILFCVSCASTPLPYVATDSLHQQEMSSGSAEVLLTYIPVSGRTRVLRIGTCNDGVIITPASLIGTALNSYRMGYYYNLSLVLTVEEASKLLITLHRMREASQTQVSPNQLRSIQWQKYQVSGPRTIETSNLSQSMADANSLTFPGYIYRSWSVEMVQGLRKFIGFSGPKSVNTAVVIVKTNYNVIELSMEQLQDLISDMEDCKKVLDNTL
jgi:hypothetical protein